MAEQLVDVPIQHIVELLFQHPVDILVPQVGVSGGGQQGFLSGQGSVGLQKVDISASGCGVSGGLHVSPPRQSTSQRQFLVVEVLAVFLVFTQNRVQQFCMFLRSAFLSGLWRRLFSLLLRNALLSGSWSRSLISPFLVETFLVVEVFTVYAPDRVSRRFLDLNTAMMLLGVHAEVEVLEAPSQDRAQQPEVELGIAGLLDASSYRLVQKGVASLTPMRWPSLVLLRLVAFGCLVSWQGLFARNASVTFSVRTGPDGFMEAHDIEAVGRG